ncbi:MAG: hypothetical protein GX454_06065 [Brooklawnia sp.]|nr:hypothetical protein [Brooklawnia sp.]
MRMNAASPPSGFEDYFEWTAGGMIDPDTAPESQWAAIAALSNLQLLDRIIEHERDLRRRDRMMKARLHFTRNLEAAVASNQTPGAFPPGFTTAPGRIRGLIHKKLPEAMCLGLLIAAEMDNPFSPFAIKVSQDQHARALETFARDLGVPARWAAQADDSVAAVAPGRGRGDWKTWAMVIGGGLVAIASVPLAFVLAPAGLAGGAAFVAGLAALGGPAGMMGGLSIVASVAAAGGTTMTAGVFLAGSAAQVETRVKILHANAHAKHSLRPATPVPEIPVLEAMLRDLRQDLERHREIDDGRSSAPIKEIDKKIKTVEGALTALSRLKAEKGRRNR